MISFAITVKNEGQYVQDLLEQLVPYCQQSGDEIVVLDDYSDDKFTEDTLYDFLEKSAQEGSRYSMKLGFHKLEGDFAAHKNHLNSLCKGDYILQIDADELLNENLLENLRELLEYNPEVELFHFPRVNIVNGLTDEDIRKWGWQVNEKGWCMFPDYQGRLYKNSPNIKWEGKVHERIVGAETISVLPPEEEWSIIHVKDISRQRLQNSFYETISK
jgi:glycosyltransferase involved in cell wall biosynthesis